jgi:NitT/TauT family transport system substrate-binding protein
VLLVAPAGAEPIRIAYSGVSASGTPVWLAKEEGIFAKHGLEADLVAVRSAPLQVTALVSNEVQFVRGSASSMLTAAAQGAKLKIILSLFAERASYNFLVAPSITKPSDLRGKKIGVQDFSGLLWSLTMLSLREMGLDPQKDNINIQAIGDSTVIAQSLASGIIDGAALDRAVRAAARRGSKSCSTSADRSAFSSPFMVSRRLYSEEPADRGELHQGAHRGERDHARAERARQAVLQKHLKTDRQLAELGYKFLLEDLTPIPLSPSRV